MEVELTRPDADGAEPGEVDLGEVDDETDLDDADETDLDDATDEEDRA